MRPAFALAVVDLSGGACAVPSVGYVTGHTPATVEKSSGFLAVERRFDAYRYRAGFQDRWAAMLRANFDNSAHVASYFGVNEKTARNWMDCTACPGGASAVLAVCAIPGAAAFLMGEGG